MMIYMYYIYIYIMTYVDFLFIL